MAENLKLIIEMVPQTAWGQNARAVLSRASWNKVREIVKERCQGKCEICGTRVAEPDAHEVWDWNDATCQQTLIRVLGICGLCHHVKHLGLAELLAYEHKLNLQTVVHHFCRVNECSREDFSTCRMDEGLIWYERSRKNWTMDCSHIFETYGVKPKVSRPRKAIA